MISIITPAYNRAALLPRMINSVRNQTFEAWELIIVDDGSTDHTRDVVNSFEDSRIKYFYTSNSGAADSRNTGAGNATGEFLIFLDSDDEVDPRWLQLLYEEAADGQTHLVSCGWERLDENNNLVKKGLPKCLGPMFNNITASFLSGTLLMSKEIFQLTGGYDSDLESAQHTDLMLRILAVKNKNLQVRTVPEYLLKIHDHQGVKIRKNHNAVLNGTVKILEKHPEIFQLNRNDHFDYLSVAGVSAVKMGRINEAKKYFQKASKVKLFDLKNLLRLMLVYIPFLPRLLWGSKTHNG